MSGDGEPPEWFTENEKLQHFLTEADKLVGRWSYVSCNINCNALLVYMIEY